MNLPQHSLPTPGSGRPDLPRKLGHLARPTRPDSPTLLCVAGLHGNEPAGVKALERVFAAFDGDTSDLRGTFVGFVGNRGALALGQRFVNDDLNRIWTRERVEHVRSLPDDELQDEDAEMRELDREFEDILDPDKAGPVVFLDLHTTSGPGPAFANLDDTLANRRFAMAFPVPLVVGIEEELAGTLANHLATFDLVTLGFEGGQHEDPDAVDRCEAAVWIALEESGVLASGTRPEVAAARQRLETDTGDLPHVVEVRYRHHIDAGSGFRMAPGFVNFQAVRKGQTLALDRNGQITSLQDGLILMPLYQQQGDDGFFLVREIRPIWLRISAILRRLHLERMIHWFPGVTRRPDEEDRFLVDLRIARWYALELFHLLGYRRFHRSKERLEMVRRREP